MNKIYKSVWCEATGTWVATSETARAKGKRATATKLAVAQAVLAGAALMAGGTAAHAAGADNYFDVSGTATGSDNAVAKPGMNALAAGSGAQANGKDSVAIGTSAVANATDTAAIGASASAGGRYAAAFGYAANAQFQDSVALGHGAIASGLNAFAGGSGANAGAYGTAVGTGAIADANATAVGVDAAATGESSLALGNSATAAHDNSVALGAGSATTVGAQSNYTAYALSAPQTSVGEVNVGNRTITGVAAGAADTDAVNVSQLKAVDGKIATATANSVQYDATPDDKSLVTLAGPASTDGGATGGTTITNLHQGAVSATSTDAVNGAQLYAIAGDTSSDYVQKNGSGVKYVRTNEGTLTPDDAHANAMGASALGYNAQANGVNSIAIGYQGVADGSDAIALGSYAEAAGSDSGAFGTKAHAVGSNSLALGANTTANGDNSVALGQGSIADRANTVSVGSAGSERQVTHVAAGTADTDAVNVSQLKSAAAAASRYFKATGSDDVQDQAIANGDHSVAMGSFADASGVNTFAGGTSSWAQGDFSTAVGTLSYAQGYGSVAFGYRANAVADNSVALGQGSIADRANTVSVGSGGAERQITNVAAGVQGTDAVNVNQLNAVAAQGAATAAKVDGAVMYDQNPDGSVNKNSITLGDAAAGGTVIHNVADGVAAGDAVNVGQLNGAINNAVVNTANPFVSAEGDRDTEGAVSSGTHSLAGGANAQATGTNAAAIGANSVASGNNATALGAAANASADNSVALGQGSVADRANTVSVGAAGQERQATNVAAGVQGTDAVNVNQMQQSVSGAVSQANSYTNDQIRSARRDSYGGTASALAAAGLPQAVLPGHGMVAVAGGTYGGQSAMAIGVSQLSETGKWVYKVQGTTDSRGQFGASVGAGMHW